MKTGSVDYLIFVEDPGAANGIVGLPAALRSRNLNFALVVAGHAIKYLDALDVAYDPVAPDQTADSLLSHYSPRGILTGTSENLDSLGLELNSAARNARIPCASFVDSPYNAEYRFRGHGESPLAYAPDWILAADEETRIQFQKMGFAPERLHVCGHPYFDRIRDTAEQLAAEGRSNVRRRTIPGAPGDRPAWTFISEISDGFGAERYQRGKGYTLHGRGGSDNRTDIVLEEVLDALVAIIPRPYMVLRLHPKNQVEEFSAYADEIDHISDKGMPAELVFASDLVIGMTSFLLTEAVVMGRPTISVVPDPEGAGWRPDDRLIPVVHTRGDLRRLLGAAASDPTQLIGKPATDVIKFGATDRMADFLLELIAEG